MMDWILCSERLPETDDDVLCWYEYTITEGIRIGEKNQTYGIGWYSKFMSRWNWDYIYGNGCRILAWMPLPKPYEEENSNAI